jgi:hypothetical protein
VFAKSDISVTIRIITFMGNNYVKKHLSRMMVVAVLAFGAYILVAGNNQAFAVTSTTNNNLNTLKISPLRTDLSIAPGKSGKVSMKVTNLTKAPMTIHPIENDFVAGDEKGTPALILDENKFAPTHSLKHFMAPLKDVTIPAGAIQDIPLEIDVPASAKAGGYYGAVRFAPTSGDSSGSVNLNASAASLVLLTVPGPVVEQLNLTNSDIMQSGKVVSGFVNNSDGLSLSVRFENKGNLQDAPFGQVYVKQGDKVVYSQDFNQTNPRDMVLPDSARRWDIPLKNIGTFGKYTIGATFTYGTKNQSVEVSKTIWIIPTTYIIAGVVGLIVLIGLIVGIWLFLRGYKRRILRKNGRGGLGIH